MKFHNQLLTMVLIAFSPCLVVADETVEFATHIQPIFLEHCGKCHGAEKQLGKLQLTSAAAIRGKLSDEPSLIVGGNPDASELYERLVLPKDHKKRMPKQADPLSDDTVQLIRNWIQQGAKFAVEDNAQTESELPTVPPASGEAIARLKASGAHVMPLFADSPLLDISYALRAEPAGDAELQLLEAVAEQVISLNLKDSRASETGYSSLAKLAQLRALHLEGSSITDNALKYVSDLTLLEYLNLFDTEISDAGLLHLAPLRHLRKLYLWKTQVSYDAATELAGRMPKLDFNLGHDHPRVRQERFRAQIDNVTQQLSEIQVEEKAVQLQLDELIKRRDTLTSQLAELNQLLKQLPLDSAQAGVNTDKTPITSAADATHQESGSAPE